MCLLMLQHLRVEENPILKMPHLEAASILLVGPTLKKFNDRGLWVAQFLFISLHLDCVFPSCPSFLSSNALSLNYFCELPDCCSFC